ncbi:hypothetical protein C0Q70_10664 [Pomacea canaliculata]|uniref:Uncharacterized protein n=1 Tax=Pomacea canaliculata TaxID=400727 RepID=A0A2T7P3V4_POMCA|nr:hypothetical protein C0Q70_10664 [Pomacea canaliculata]
MIFTVYVLSMRIVTDFENADGQHPLHLSLLLCRIVSDIPADPCIMNFAFDWSRLHPHVYHGVI